MKNTNWREIVEIVGVVSMVAALLLLATEVRQSNRIAVADMRLKIAGNEIQGHFERATNPEFAKLFAKLENPESHLITATEKQQIKGLASQYVNNAYAVQVAFDQGFLTREQIDDRTDGFRRRLQELPGLVPDMIALYDSAPHLQGHEIFSAIEQARAEPALTDQ